MSKKEKIYFTKQKFGPEVRATRERSLDEFLNKYLQVQARVRPQPIPKSSEELLYKARLKEKLKPPSVKMADEEARKKLRLEEEQRVAEEVAFRDRQEQAMQDLIDEFRASRTGAPSAASTPGPGAAAPPMFGPVPTVVSRASAQRIDRLYPLTAAERKAALTPRQSALRNEIETQTRPGTFARNLNFLLARKKGTQTDSGIKIMEKVVDDKKLLDTLAKAKADGNVFEPTFERAITAFAIRNGEVP
jgi:hypothetical protein